MGYGKYSIRLVAMLFWGVLGTPAWATTVAFNTTHITGNTWETAYTVTNDTLATAIDEFTIYFDVSVYDNLVSVAAPTGWDPLVIQPDPFLPDDGFYDALVSPALSGIAAGSALSGFSVRFNFSGVGTPGPQFFEVVDPVTFTSLDSDFTQAAVVPLPAALWLFISGLSMLLGIRIKAGNNVN